MDLDPSIQNEDREFQYSHSVESDSTEWHRHSQGVIANVV